MWVGGLWPVGCVRGWLAPAPIFIFPGDARLSASRGACIWHGFMEFPDLGISGCWIFEILGLRDFGGGVLEEVGIL